MRKILFQTFNEKIHLIDADYICRFWGRRLFIEFVNDSRSYYSYEGIKVDKFYNEYYYYSNLIFRIWGSEIDNVNSTTYLRNNISIWGEKVSINCYFLIENSEILKYCKKNDSFIKIK